MNNYYPLPNQLGNAFKIIPGYFVTTSDGTGIVHIAPTFGADDFRVAKENGIAPMTNAVNAVSGTSRRTKLGKTRWPTKAAP